MTQFILRILTVSMFLNKITHGFISVHRNHLILKRRVCSQSQGKCGSLCYDTKIYTCQNLYGKKPFLCHKEDSVCGDSCYDPNEKNCYGSGEDAVACHWGHRLCPANGRCYDPKSSSCPSSPGLSSSSSSFYPTSSNNNNWDTNRQSPSWKSPGWEITPLQNNNKPFSYWNSNNNNNNGNGNSNSNRNPFGGQFDPKPINTFMSSSCGMGNHLCGAICYDPTKQTCYGEQEGPPRLYSLVCPKGNKRCGNSCYDPIISRCSIDGDSNMNSMSVNSQIGSSHSHNYCSYGHVLCGSKCIDPMEQSCNNNNNDDISYSGNNKWNNNNKDSGQGSWNNNGGMGIGVSSQKSQSWNSNNNGGGGNNGGGENGNNNNGCGSGLSKCGATCYDPFKQSCLGNNESDRLLCESGQEACGKKCYDPFNQRCINTGSGGNSGGNRDGGGMAGGGLMFFSGGSGSGNSFWGKNGGATKKIICKWNESACGAKCYDPQKDRCNGNSMTSSDNDF